MEKTENKPDIVKELIDLAYELMNFEIDKKIPIFSHEIFFTLPAVKKSISICAAIEREIAAQSLVASIILLRSLIETVTNYCYVLGLEKGEGFYEKYLTSGRLRVHRKGKGWEKVTVADQISYTEKTLRMTGVQRAYDNCSDLVHPSSESAKLVFFGGGAPKNGNLRMAVTVDDAHLDGRMFTDIRKTTIGLLIAMKTCLEQEIANKAALKGLNKIDGYSVDKVTIKEPGQD